MAEYQKQHAATLDALSQVAAKLKAQIETDEGNLSNYLQKSEAETTYAKNSELEKKADASALANYLTKTDAQDEYAKKTDVASAYIAKGSVENLEGLEGQNVEGNVGFVYNVTNAFTTDANFVEGAGKSYPAGTNVVVVNDEETYKFDALSGIVDLSDYETAAQAGAKYASKSDVADVVKQDGLTSALEPYAKTEDIEGTYETKANVTSGLADKADKTALASYLEKEEAGTTYVAKTDIATEEEITALVNELFPAE